jgi:hydrogenase expression/formation protein HypD
LKIIVNKDFKNIIKLIKETAHKIGRNVNLMEVCGTHTQAVARHGIRQLMPKNIKLISGPGCPVCVTAQEDIDAIVSLALAGVPVATYGDMLRVPGHFGSLDQAREKGAKVFSVYSTEDALELQKEYPDLVFFGLGFETTAPMTAYAVKKGLAVYSTHKLFLPAMKALLEIGELKIDGYICPGHVSTIIGVEPYKEMKVPQVITGFEADDILVAIFMLLKQIKEGRAEVENEYLRSVRSSGNPKAYKAIFDVFEVKGGNWRGFGVIPNSGLEIKKKYKAQDAKIKYKNIIKKSTIGNPPASSRKASRAGRQSTIGNACRCGEIIRGLKKPKDCPLFKKACIPEKPFGPCMVSVEGACNVEYRYGDKL